MPRARNSYISDQQTAAPRQGSGCLSGFLIPPLAVLLVGIIITVFLTDLNTPVLAESAPSQDLQNDLTTLTRNNTTTSISPIFTPEIHHWADSIARWAESSNIDPNLAAVVMQIESCGDPRATSRAGATGLFQVMPYHFHEGENPYQPDTNALRGLDYLNRSLNTANGNARLALAGYNGGIGVINRGEWTWTAETARYVKYGFPIYEDTVREVIASPSLKEWYDHFGASLCRQAAQRLGID